MIAVTFRPLGPWEGPSKRGMHRSPFKASWTSTLQLLERELTALNADQAVIQIDVTEDRIRVDGWPYANALAATPGVVLSFESKYGPLRYATDRFDKWQDNLRAIALGLEALRKVDRYGITKSGEQYTGWKQLSAGNGGPTTREQALDLVARVAQVDPATLGDSVLAWRSTWRLALRKAHPDHGGTTDQLMAVREAGRLLGVA